MRVVEAGDHGLAWCREDGPDARRVEVMTGMVEPVTPGDVLLVHAGTALRILDAAHPPTEAPHP